MEDPVICELLYSSAVASGLMPAFAEIQFTDVYQTGQEVNVGIIIWLDSYWRSVRPHTFKGSDRKLMA